LDREVWKARDGLGKVGGGGGGDGMGWGRRVKHLVQPEGNRGFKKKKNGGKYEIFFVEERR